MNGEEQGGSDGLMKDIFTNNNDRVEKQKQQELTETASIEENKKSGGPTPVGYSFNGKERVNRSSFMNKNYTLMENTRNMGGVGVGGGVTGGSSLDRKPYVVNLPSRTSSSPPVTVYDNSKKITTNPHSNLSTQHNHLHQQPSRDTLIGGSPNDPTKILEAYQNYPNDSELEHSTPAGGIKSVMGNLSALENEEGVVERATNTVLKMVFESKKYKFRIEIK